MECFGESSDDEGDNADGSNSMAITRDESCGVCSFHPNVEVSLLTHIRNTLPSTRPSSPDERAKLQHSGAVLEAVDAFCVSRHWMMHIGPEKGVVLVRALRDAMCAKEEHSSRNSDSFVAVELGTYCGYAALRMARAFLQAKAESSAAMEFHLHTTEVNDEYAGIAKEIIRLSGMEDLISVHGISYDGRDTDVAAVLRQALQERHASQRPDRNMTATIDFLFLDHDKDSYKSDLRKLEAARMICRGTKVVADNVLFAGIYDYLQYVRQRETEGVVETRTIPCCVEYSAGSGSTSPQGGTSPFRDGIEITDYLMDI